MPSLPFVCIECGRTYQTVKVSRAVLPGERAAGLCPEHLTSVDLRLFGGRQLVTPSQHVTGPCEFCQTAPSVESIDERLHRAAGGHSGDEYPSRKKCFA